MSHDQKKEDVTFIGIGENGKRVIKHNTERAKKLYENKDPMRRIRIINWKEKLDFF